MNKPYILILAGLLAVSCESIGSKEELLTGPDGPQFQYQIPDFSCAPPEIVDAQSGPNTFDVLVQIPDIPENRSRVYVNVSCSQKGSDLVESSSYLELSASMSGREVFLSLGNLKALTVYSINVSIDYNGISIPGNMYTAKTKEPEMPVNTYFSVYRNTPELIEFQVDWDDRGDKITEQGLIVGYDEYFNKFTSTEGNVLKDFQPGKRAYIKAYATNSCGTSYSQVISLVTFEYGEMKPVDLGLSVCWANQNVGATYSNDNGLYLSYDEIEPYLTDGWRLPTHEEWTELISAGSFDNRIIDYRLYTYSLVGYDGAYCIPQAGFYRNEEKWGGYSYHEKQEDSSFTLARLSRSRAYSDYFSSEESIKAPVRLVKNK